jgi:hypothetical protein
MRAIETGVQPLFEGASAVLLRGASWFDEEDAVRMMAALAKPLGVPRRYPQSIYGDGMIQRISRPAPSLAAQGLDWHTEDTYSTNAPLFLALMCLLGDSSVKTHLAALSGPPSQLSPEVLVKPDPYLYGSGSLLYRTLAFEGRLGPGWRYDPALIIENASSGTETGVTRQTEWQTSLEAGDILIINNHRAAHARGERRPDNPIHSSLQSQRLLLRMILD